MWEEQEPCVDQQDREIFFKIFSGAVEPGMEISTQEPVPDARKRNA